MRQQREWKLAAATDRVAELIPEEHAGATEPIERRDDENLPGDDEHGGERHHERIVEHGKGESAPVNVAPGDEHRELEPLEQIEEPLDDRGRATRPIHRRRAHSRRNASGARAIAM